MIQRLTARQVAAMRAEGKPMLFIDVREPNEYAIARVDGAQLIPMSEIAKRVSEIQPKPGEPVVLMCHHGVRSLRCGMFLAQSGIENIVNLEGGIDAWSLEVDPKIPRY